MKKKNNDGETALHLAAKNPISFKTILELYPKAERLAAVKEKNCNSNTVLHFMAENPVSLEVALALYPETDRLAAVKKKNNAGETVLQSASRKLESFIVILKSLPATDRLAAVSNDTVLYYAHYNLTSLPAILELLPETDRLAAIEERNYNGETVLHRAAENPISFKTILELCPEAERLTAVEEKNYNGETVLPRAIYYPDSLKVALALYPETDRLAAVKKKNNAGKTVLHHAIKYPNLLKAILELLLPQDSKEPLHQLLTQCQEHSLNEWQVFMSILGIKNNLLYNAKADLLLAGEDSAIKICPAHLLLNSYFIDKTDSRKHLVETLLTEHKKKSTPSEDSLALAIIMKAEGREKEKEAYIRQFISSAQDGRSTKFFKSSSSKPTHEELLQKLIKEKPETDAFIHAYQVEVVQVLNLPEPIQSLGFDSEYDKHFPL